jgi:2-amino-4-hydroxy-6-hydroxymethyldihydropteridine diphosphokinase
MSNCVYSIGSNLGDRFALLHGALEAMRPWLQAASPVYHTPPWGPVPQGEYLNAVLLCADDTAGPADWLTRAQAAEAAAGRVRDVRWGPRTLDVDVIDVDGMVVDTGTLRLPHPRAGERAFVLVPWLAVAPDAELAGRPVAELLAALPAGEVDAVRKDPAELR